jgi:UDP-N-acetyl-D-glucosamine dehydrogenase
VTSMAARRVTPDAAELAAADAVVLLTDHDAFDGDLVVANARYVLDTRHRLAGHAVEHL